MTDFVGRGQPIRYADGRKEVTLPSKDLNEKVRIIHPTHPKGTPPGVCTVRQFNDLWKGLGWKIVRETKPSEPKEQE